MTERLRPVVYAIVAMLALAGVWLHARMMQRDDRPPIIVRGGSIYFNGGVDGNADECCNNWKKDKIGRQWKPKPDDKTGVRAFAVTVDGVPSSVCSITGAEAAEVFIDHKSGSGTLTFRLYIKAKYIFPFFFGKHEPKIDSPAELKNEALSSENPPTKPGRLEYDHEGYISRLKVGGTECRFDETHERTLVIRIQPKTDQ